MKFIYLYTTETYQSKNWYKIGETTTNPIKRIQSQDNASNPEPLFCISYWRVPHGLSDKTVHKKLVDLGFAKVRGNREWFELSNTPKEDVESAFDELNVKTNSESLETEFVSSIYTQSYKDIWWFNGSTPPEIAI